MMLELDSRYMISYSSLIATHCLTWFHCKLQDRLRILNGPEFDFSMSLNVKCNFVLDFLLMSNSKHMSFSMFFGYMHLEEYLLSFGHRCIYTS